MPRALRPKLSGDNEEEFREDRKQQYLLCQLLISSRKKAGLSQTDVARRMDTHPPAISRIESNEVGHSPSVRTLRKYATAIGCELRISLTPIQAAEEVPKAASKNSMAPPNHDVLASFEEVDHSVPSTNMFAEGPSEPHNLNFEEK